MGRSLEHKAPPSKKPKTAPSSVVPVGPSAESIFEHLDALGDRLKLRVKTEVQLLITDETASKSCKVLCSGSTSLKKLGQLVAFLTKHTDNYEYHIQRGTSLKGSYLELSLDCGTDQRAKVWLGDNALKKKAEASGIPYALDKPIKLVQVFQGLVVRTNSGMTYDVEREATNKSLSLVWISDKGDKYTIEAEGVLPSKSIQRGSLPLPRIVDEDARANARMKTGFGRFIRMANRVLRGDRLDLRKNTLLCKQGLSRSELRKFAEGRLTVPLCHGDGTIGMDPISGAEWMGEDRVNEERYSSEIVHSVGAPTSYTR